jgi:hypothetical protein
VFRQVLVFVVTVVRDGEIVPDFAPGRGVRGGTSALHAAR